MNYIEYHEIYYKFVQTKNKLRKIQNKIEDIMLKMISTSSQIKDTITDNKNISNKMLELTTKKIDLENEEKLQIELLDRIIIQRNNAEIELRDTAKHSNTDIKNKVYVMYYLDYYKVGYIAKKLGYSSSYIYNLLSEIKKTAV